MVSDARPTTRPLRPDRAPVVAPRAARAAVRDGTRERLVRRGVELLTEHGFDATGLDRLLAGEGIPKGSFYHFFPSKQAYGEAVIDAYAAYFDEKFDRLLDDASRPPLERLRAYVDEGRAGMARHRWRRGCLVGNLAQELGAHNDAFRTKLERVFREWQDRVAGCLRAAIEAGQLDPSADVDRLAQVFWIGWEGALMRAKLVRGPDPIDCFIDHFMATLPRRKARPRRSATRPVDG